MKQSELIAAIAEKNGVTKTIAKKMLESLAEIVTEQLQKGNSVVLHGSLGAFKAEGKHERQGRNPANGESITIPAHIKPCFKVSATLKKALN